VTPPDAGPKPPTPPTPPTPPPADPSKRDELWDVVVAEDWPGLRPLHAFFVEVERAIVPNSGGKVLVAAGLQADVFERLLESVWPGIRVMVVHDGEDESEVHARLSGVAPFDVILQAADVDALTQARTFRRLFMHLRADGIYLAPRIVPLDVEHAPVVPTAERVPLPNEDGIAPPPYVGDVWQLVSEAQAARLQDFADRSDRSVPFRDVLGLGRHLAEVQVYSKMLRIKNQQRALAKLTEQEADLVLAERPDLGREVCSRPPAILKARAGYTHNLERDPYFSPVMSAPKMTLRRYERPICSRGQIVTSQDLLWPDTFRHHLYPRMTNTYVEESAPRFGYVRRDVSDPDELAGAWFHLDSEWPGHFGHLMTEQVGRLWAWEDAKRREPAIKVLLTLQHDRVPMVLHAFEKDLLSVFGIAPDDVHVFERCCPLPTTSTRTSPGCGPRRATPSKRRRLMGRVRPEYSARGRRPSNARAATPPRWRRCSRGTASR
jgi:hypothetical protein